MAFTYLILNLVFLLCIVVLFLPHLVKPTRAWVQTLVVLMLLTAVFDSIIVGTGIVGYDSDKILGAYIALAPVEDFFYAILVVLIVPALWNLFGKSRSKS